MDGTQIYLILAIGSLGMLIMAGAIITFVVFYQKRMMREQVKRQALEAEYQRKMMEAALDSQEEERRRVAGDLHDSVGAMLSAVRMGLITLSRKDPSLAERMQQSKEMLDDTIESVRRISRDLMPSTLEKFGLLQAVHELCNRFEETAHIPIEYHEQADQLRLSKKQEMFAFRIVQEVLNNILKHARATQIVVHVSGDSELCIEMADNGIGFDAEAVKADPSGRGLGLFNMENRARLLGGSVRFEKIYPAGAA
ncbi:MAG: sensor histidine kinase [Bacteroidia bacterium]|nr:sensor histidine kinase [Bacteroidia bacterium]